MDKLVALLTNVTWNTTDLLVDVHATDLCTEAFDTSVPGHVATLKTWVRILGHALPSDSEEWKTQAYKPQRAEALTKLRLIGVPFTLQHAAPGLRSMSITYGYYTATWDAMNSESEHERLMTRAVLLFGITLRYIVRSNSKLLATVLDSLEPEQVSFLANERLLSGLFHHRSNTNAILSALEERKLHILTPKDILYAAEEFVSVTGRALGLVNLRHVEFPLPLLESVLQNWKVTCSLHDADAFLTAAEALITRFEAKQAAAAAAAAAGAGEIPESRNAWRALLAGQLRTGYLSIYISALSQNLIPPPAKEEDQLRLFQCEGKRRPDFFSPENKAESTTYIRRIATLVSEKTKTRSLLTLLNKPPEVQLFLGDILVNDFQAGRREHLTREEFLRVQPLLVQIRVFETQRAAQLEAALNRQDIPLDVLYLINRY